jgi:hypothetical protein
MGLVGILTNQATKARLQRVHQQIVRRAASEELSARRSSPQLKRRRMGLIPKAIAAVLAEHKDGMRVRDIAAAVAARLGEPVPRSSVKSCLWREAQSESGAFEQIGQGRYRLRRQAP